MRLFRFPIATDIILLIEVFIWKFENVVVYICLVGGVVIFDESWAGKGIDNLVNTVHGPIFSDAEVNPAANLTYSENRLADIHGNTREPFEGSIFYLGDWEMNSWYNFLCEDMPSSSMPAINNCGRRSDRISLEKMRVYIPLCHIF